MLITIRSSCRDGETCPAIHYDPAAPAAMVVQGYTTDDPHVVRIPVTLAPEWAAAAGQRGGTDLLVRGQRVTDPNMLAELNLPQGESAVQTTDLPTLEVAAC